MGLGEIFGFDLKELSFTQTAEGSRASFISTLVQHTKGALRRGSSKQPCRNISSLDLARGMPSNVKGFSL